MQNYEYLLISRQFFQVETSCLLPPGYQQTINDFLNMKAEEVAFSELSPPKGISGINIQIGELYRSLSLTEKLPNLTYIRWTGDQVTGVQMSRRGRRGAELLIRDSHTGWRGSGTMGTLSSRTRAMKLTPRDLVSASTIPLLLLASAASAQHATESLTSEVVDITIIIVLLRCS